MISTHITPKKSLGQHFLMDKNIAWKIVSSFDPQPSQTIVEIGPGNGVLTEMLVQSGAQIFAIDIDQRAIENLKENFPIEKIPQITFIQEDILNTDLSNFTKPFRVIGNLPYNITSLILFHLIDYRKYISDAVVMIQREVAERICAHPKTKAYGILSVLLQLHADVKILFHVSPNVFYPKPKVESSVISIAFNEHLVDSIIEYDFFKRVVRETFGKRRKTLLNGLRYMKIPMNIIPNELEIYLAKRPEELDVEDFIFVSNTLHRAIQTDAQK